MSTVINNPSGVAEDSGASLIIGVALTLVLIALFFVYIWPAMMNGRPAATDNGTTNINVEVPAPVVSENTGQ